jgi:acyl-coenzyme A synthetase/AMP-(fatty) acid ligase
MVVACVVLNGSETGWHTLDTHCRSSVLARYKKPRAYLMMESLPRNAANKVLRHALRETVSKARETGKAGTFHLVDG